jgi:hypothetical protein
MNSFRPVAPMAGRSPVRGGRKFQIYRALCSLGVTSAVLWNAHCARGQEDIKMSAASDQADQLAIKASEPDYYNLALGPVKLRLQGEMDVAFNDNVNYTRTNREADIILTPGFNAAGLWPVTEKNTLQFSGGFGYMDYLRHSSLSQPYVAPNSALEFKIYSGDFTINIHDRFSVIEDVAQDPTISGTGEFGQLENISGLGVDWNLYKLLLSLGYDHDLVLATTPDYDYINHNSDLFTLRAALIIHDTTKLGVEIGGGVTSYDQTVLDNNSEFTAGLFYNARFSEHISAALSGGYFSYMFSPNGAANALVNSANGLNNYGGYYADLSLTHQVNWWFDQTLSGGRQEQLGITANLTDLYYARYQANFGFIRNTRITTELLYENGETIGGPAQTLSIYSGSVGLTYNLTQKLSGGLTYNLQVKRADPASDNYVQNLLELDFRYSF